MSARFSSVLVANRGEIACRIIRAARDEGLSAIAVYSDADAQALHVRLADAAVRIGPASAAQSYLSSDALIAAAKAVRRPASSSSGHRLRRCGRWATRALPRRV
jgi:acetyl/propionyl-CoA carboxylase alpha subunit